MKRRALILLALMHLNNLTAALELDHLEKEGAAFHEEIARKVAASVEARPEAIKTCLERIRNLVLSDRVGFFYNVSARMENSSLVLEGELERPEFRAITAGVFRHLGFTDIVDRLQPVPDLKADPDPFAVATAAYVLTWSRPDLTGIPMDEALFGEPVYVLKELPDALLIKNVSGYWGYAAKSGLKRVSRETFVQLLNAPKAMFVADYGEKALSIPTGSRLLIKEWGPSRYCTLLGPLGEAIKVPKNVCVKHEREGDIARVLAQARSFLQRPYNLGGKNSATGIDCSGLIQMAYRTVGLNLARDAKQQYLNGNLILPCAVEALQAGDALFFMSASGQVDHTALYLGGQEIIHATGDSVKIQSMNPASENYCKRFDHDFIGAKRYWW